MKVASNWAKLKAKQQKQAKKPVSGAKKAGSEKLGVAANKVKIRTPLTKMAAKSAAAASAAAAAHQPTDQTENSLHNTKAGKILAMDCEFVGVGEGGVESELARVSIVNFFGNVIFDTFVQPRDKVTDWRTWVSGVTPADMKNAISFKEAQEKVAQLLEGRVLVGHAIQNDLEALFLTHPRAQIRDTSKHTPYRQKYANGKTPSLKKLALHMLKKNIQDGQHSSIEDARVTMELYKADRKKFEELSMKKRSPKNK